MVKNFIWVFTAIYIFIYLDTFSQNIVTIKFDDSERCNHSLTHYCQDIKYIPLFHDEPISMIYNLRICNSSIIISSPGKPLFRYNLNGKWINSIGSIGKGPGQYMYSRVFAVDEQSNTVAVYSSKKIYFFEFTGKFIHSVNVNSDQYFSSLDFLNSNNLILTCGNTSGNTENNWIILNTNGEILSAKKNHINFNNPYYIAVEHSEITYKYNDTCCYCEMFNDTIFEIVEEGYKPRFIFAKDKYRPTPELFVKHVKAIRSRNINGTQQNYYQPVRIVETTNYLFVIYSSQNPKMRVACFDKATEKLCNFKINNLNGGIINDFDGGVDFYPMYYYKIDSEEYLVSWFFPYELQTHIASDHFKKATPNYPEKKKRLKKLANSLDEDDNPILMFVKLNK